MKNSTIDNAAIVVAVIVFGIAIAAIVAAAGNAANI